MKVQKRNRDAHKRIFFTTLWKFEIMIHETSLVKKIHFQAALIPFWMFMRSFNGRTESGSMCRFEQARTETKVAASVLLYYFWSV